MAGAGKGGIVLELVNPGRAPQTVQPSLKLFQRKPEAPSTQTYLRAFDQSRDRPEAVAEQTKVALMLNDEQLSKKLLDENYTLLREQAEPVTLPPGGRSQLDFAVANEPKCAMKPGR
jgi:hypothetical protein